MAEEQETDLEKQMKSMFEATLEQKAQDMAEQVWKEKMGHCLIPEIPEEQIDEEVKKTVHNFYWSSGGPSSLEALQDNVKAFMYEYLKQRAHEQVTKVYEEILREEENQERIRKVCRTALTEVLGNMEDQVNDKETG